MKIISVTEEAGGKVFELEDSIVSEICWVNPRLSDETANRENLEILRKLLVDGVYYVGTEGWSGKRYLVTLRTGSGWERIEPELRQRFESLPHVPWT